VESMFKALVILLIACQFSADASEVVGKYLFLGCPGVTRAHLGAVPHLQRIESDQIAIRNFFADRFEESADYLIGPKVKKSVAMASIRSFFTEVHPMLHHYTIVYAGHGYQGTGNWAFDGEDISLDDIYSAWKNSAASRRLHTHLSLLINACYSGQWVKRSRDTGLHITIQAVDSVTRDGAFFTAWTKFAMKPTDFAAKSALLSLKSGHLSQGMPIAYSSIDMSITGYRGRPFPLLEDPEEVQKRKAAEVEERKRKAAEMAKKLTEEQARRPLNRLTEDAKKDKELESLKVRLTAPDLPPFWIYFSITIFFILLGFACTVKECPLFLITLIALITLIWFLKKTMARVGIYYPTQV
jgi:hypothetical protein